MNEGTNPAVGGEQTTPPAPAAAGAPPASAWPATLALVALGVALAVALFVWQERRTAPTDDVAGLRTSLGGQSSQLDALRARVEEVAAGRRRLEEELARLDERVSQEAEATSTLPDQLAQLEATINRFVGVGDKVRTAWLLAEAEHYMRIATTQLGLAGDAEVAQTALGLADETLRDLNDPRLLPVRKLLAEELTALRAVPRPDTEGIVLTLGSLADAIETLPLKRSAPAVFRAVPEPPAAELTGVERARAAVTRAFASLVSIRRVDEPVTPLLPEAEQAILVRSLDLELQLARLAVMRGDAGMYRRSIEAATLRLQRHFDAGSPDVQAVLASLEELGGAQLPEALPDISGSLAALERAIAVITQAGNSP